MDFGLIFVNVIQEVENWLRLRKRDQILGYATSQASQVVEIGRHWPGQKRCMDDAMTSGHGHLLVRRPSLCKSASV